MQPASRHPPSLRAVPTRLEGHPHLLPPITDATIPPLHAA
jgi:hypothetical protein